MDQQMEDRTQKMHSSMKKKFLKFYIKKPMTRS